MDTRDKKDLQTRLIWSQRILVMASFLVVVVLIFISAVSLLQTESAFQTLNDSNISILGITIGNAISWAFAIFFQYGQNVVLYMRKKFCKNTVVFEFMNTDFTDKKLMLFAFFLFAGVDALTNIVWYYKTVELIPDPLLNVVISVIGYTAMVVAVFSEEGLGWALDSFSKANKELADLNKWEKINNRNEKNAAERESATSAQNEKPTHQYNPQHRPNHPNQPTHTPQHHPNQNSQHRPNQNSGIKGLMGVMNERGRIDGNQSSKQKISLSDVPTPKLWNLTPQELWEMAQENKITEEQVEMILSERAKVAAVKNHRENEERYR